jgi:hypothetical protein
MDRDFGGCETYTGKHGSHAETVALVSVGQVGEDFGSGGNGDSALVSDLCAVMRLVLLIFAHVAPNPFKK